MRDSKGLGNYKGICQLFNPNFSDGGCIIILK